MPIERRRGGLRLSNTGGARPADTEDYCTVLAELTSGAQASFTASRVARGANETVLEAYGTKGAMTFRMDRASPGWWAGELHATTNGVLQRVAIDPGPSPATDAPDIIGKTMIAPLVARMLDGIRTGVTPSPSLEDGLRAQVVLDAILEAIARRTWVDVPR